MMTGKVPRGFAPVADPRYQARMPASAPPPFDVVLLAGSRPGTDPLAAAAGVSTKALVPVSGRAMIDRVARTLVDHGAIARVLVLAQQGADELADTPQTAWLASHPKVTFVQSGSGISQSLLDLMDREILHLPALVTTVDNILLDTSILDHFVGEATGSGGDIAVGMVERSRLLELFPESRRTWLKFRGGWWSGANLFWLGSARARVAITLWRQVEQDRKKGWKVLSVFGPLLLVGALLRLLTIHRAIERAGRRLGLRAQVVPLPQGYACIDADKPDDIMIIEKILADRAARQSPAP